MKTADEMRTHLIEKATEDESFRGKLLSDPRTSIEEEFDITIPESMTVEVHENTARTVHLVLPATTKLSDEDLRATSGGLCSGACLVESSY